ncbi:1-acyl-sn-glycerol-3-phosphate acyltransferase [Solimonas sp. K1W22B-7]|uniref:lysophospholipid acyltransferase family protein n=1 Tax=Solimonas sp. K1W22B-7 TaxID=2303331 RepID=UPI000E32D6D2|nr:lysophospholipid acyltransferase family protein [Solimonas sp. K1W22B-7]AXQ28370.1 1-acyl-sn-glycerol-3-phosphate acyltransferase [Solimonas sp. K1W22B-7]
MLRRLFDLVYAPLAFLVFILVLPLVCLTVILAPGAALRREIGRFGVRVLLGSIGVPLFVRGRQHLPATPALVICNHASYLDGLVLTAALPRRYTFMVQDGAADWPLAGWTLKRMGVEFVDRGNARSAAALTRTLIRRMGEGESFVIFPEGTFKADPGLLPFKNGAFMIAARAGVPVVPAGIRGTRRVYGGGNRLPRWAPVTVELAEPVRPDGSNHTAHHLRDAARAAVLRLCREPDRAHAHPAEAAESAAGAAD